MKTELLPTLLFASALFVSACSSSSPSGAGSTPNDTVHGSASASGSVNGVSVPGTSSVATSSYQSATSTSSIAIAISGDGLVCSYPAGAPNILSLSVALYPISKGGVPKPVTPGTYKIGVFSDGAVGAEFTGGNGASYASRGEVTFTTITDSLVAGTFDVTFDSGGEVTGSFSSPFCPAGS